MKSNLGKRKMEFDKIQQSKIIELFEDLDDGCVKYVITRGHRELPESVPGGDIDVLIDDTDFDRAIKISQENGFTGKKGVKYTLSKSLRKAYSKPRAVSEYVVTNPINSIELIRKMINGDITGGLRDDIKDWKVWNGNIMIHYKNHLAYTSPMNGKEIRVDPVIEESIFQHSTKESQFVVPSQVDELAHLICRGVFDKNGKFPQHYTNRCNDILDSLSEKEKERFSELLSHIFYSASTLVLELSYEREFNSIRQELREYSNY